MYYLFINNIVFYRALFLCPCVLWVWLWDWNSLDGTGVCSLILPSRSDVTFYTTRNLEHARRAMFDTFFWVSSQLSESGLIYICYFCTINPYIFDLGTTSDIFLGELSLSTDFTIKFCQNSDWISPLATSPKCIEAVKPQVSDIFGKGFYHTIWWVNFKNILKFILLC